MKMTRVKVIPEHESLTVEFKSDLKKLADSEIVDTVVALSNTDGGSLFLGIEDDGTVTGVHERHSDSTQLAAFLANNTVPPVSARVASLTSDANGTPSDAGMSVVEVEVPRSTAIVSSASGKSCGGDSRLTAAPKASPFTLTRSSPGSPRSDSSIILRFQSLIQQLTISIP